MRTRQRTEKGKVASLLQDDVQNLENLLVEMRVALQQQGAEIQNFNSNYRSLTWGHPPVILKYCLEAIDSRFRKPLGIAMYNATLTQEEVDMSADRPLDRMHHAGIGEGREGYTAQFGI